MVEKQRAFVEMPNRLALREGETLLSCVVDSNGFLSVFFHRSHHRRTQCPGRGRRGLHFGEEKRASQLSGAQRGGLVWSFRSGR